MRRSLSHLLALFLLPLGCGPASSRSPDAGDSPDRPPLPPVITVSSVDTRFVTRDEMMAAVELQLSGEPLAEAMGRDLNDYDRNKLPADLRVDTIDLAGFSTGIESYEYSKQPMNLLAFESSAGVSLAAGPVLNPAGLRGAQATQLLQDVTQVYGWASHATLLGTFDTGLGSERNPLGWPGIWPTLHPYRSFDPTTNPTNAVMWRCSMSGDEASTRTGAILYEDYECDSNSLHLPDRDTQVEKVITPGASGWADWKYSLWVMNYLQILHDSLENPVTSVPASELAEVGLPNNLVRPDDPDTFLGVYLGSSNVEGFQAAFLLTTMDNQFQQWLSSLTTTDGVTLSGFSDLATALHYDFSAPLRWIPAEIAVTEETTGEFPQPTAYTLQSAESRLIDLAGLLGGVATLYALTDASNTNVGGAQTALPWFDGDPFPADNQLPDGEATLHDRALALMRFLIVTLDRVHADPTTGVLVDTATFARGQPTRQPTVDIASVTYSMQALRQARRALTSQLELYSNNTPDMATRATILDGLPFTGAPGGATFSERLNALIDAQAALLLEHLTLPDGEAFEGWNVATGMPIGGTTSLDAHAGAIRGLLIGYLVTGDTRYRDRALVVFQRLELIFFDATAHVYTPDPAPMTEITYTPRRFGLLQGALRDLYLLVGSRPGQESLGALLEQRLARMNKLVLNGWNDLNGDEKVDWPGECIRVVDGLPRGGLQMAERGLTGETGSLDDSLSADMRVITTDREQDCVPDITAAHLPAALAHEIRLRVEPQ